MSSTRIELLTIIYLLTSPSIHGFTSSFHSLSSLTTSSILPKPIGKRLTFNRKNRIINIEHDSRTLFYSTTAIDGASLVNDTFINTESTSEISSSLEDINEGPVEIINDSATEQVTIAIPELVNADSTTSEQQALQIINDMDVKEFVSDILPESTPEPTSVGDISTSLDDIVASSESLQSPDILQPIVDDIKLVEPSKEVLQLISSEVSTSNPDINAPDTPEKKEESTIQDIIDVPSVKSISRFAIGMCI